MSTLDTLSPYRYSLSKKRRIKGRRSSPQTHASPDPLRLYPALQQKTAEIRRISQVHHSVFHRRGHSAWRRPRQRRSYYILVSYIPLEQYLKLNE